MSGRAIAERNERGLVLDREAIEDGNGEPLPTPCAHIPRNGKIKVRNMPIVTPRPIFDGYPSYDLYVGGKLLWNFSHVKNGTSPLSLFPPLDVKFVPPRTFDIEKCCEK